jgi:predicted nuclease of predicted toxin-antitoxin system
MPPAIRFHLDENVDPAIANGLRRHGIDATTSAESHLLRADDERQLGMARLERRVLVTHDADFLRFHAQRVHHAGIVFIPKGVRPIGEVVRSLLILVECLSADEMVDHVEYL